MCLGIPGRVVEISRDDDLLMGAVDFGGVRCEVCLAYVADEVSEGDYVIVHVGFAISVVDKREAERTLELLSEMSRIEDLGRVADVTGPDNGSREGLTP